MGRVARTLCHFGALIVMWKTFPFPSEVFVTWFACVGVGAAGPVAGPGSVKNAATCF